LIVSNANASIVITNITVTESTGAATATTSMTDNKENLMVSAANSNQLAVPGSPRPRLNTAEIKERLLRFCQRKTAGYQVSPALSLYYHIII